MKIAFLMYSFIPQMGGAQIFAYNLINQLSADNHEIHLYLPYKLYLQFTKVQNVNNYKVIPILRHEYFTAKYWPGLIRMRLKLAQKIQQYDVWQVIGTYPAGWVAKDLAKIVPVILRSHGDDIQKDAKLEYGMGLNPYIDKKISKTLSKMTHLVALTESVKKCYQEYNIPETKITEISNGVSLERFNRKVDSNILRKKYGIKNNQIFILTVGRYHIKKGYEYIPEAARFLKENGISFKWVIVGKGVSILHSNLLERQVSDLVILKEEIGLNNSYGPNNSFNIPNDSLIQLYKSADLFVMPSIIETFGMVLIEAMAAGLPIITTNAPGCRDVVSNNYNGILVAPKNSEALGKGILKVINNPNLKKSLIENGKNSVIKYDWGNIAREYEHLYHHAINKKN